MSGKTRTYDSTVARIAGNILSGVPHVGTETDQLQVRWAVAMARAIVAEVERTEPKPVSLPIDSRGEP